MPVIAPKHRPLGALILAPMEGLADPPLRHILLRTGAFDWMVSEFVRVTDQRLPKKTFLRLCPELASSQHRLRVQLLGSHPEMLADNAKRAIDLGSYGLDLNFGCPSKTVNNSCGGAALLKEPHRIEQIIRTVRQHLEPQHTLSAKVRLGYAQLDEAQSIFDAVLAGGANEVVIHARTKDQGYRPPAFWWKLRHLYGREKLRVLVNGEIWDCQDYWQARWQSGCQDCMLGRGAISDPDLALRIRAMQQGQSFTGRNWLQLCQDLTDFVDLSRSRMPERYVDGRLKQWLKLLSRHWPQAQTCLQQGKQLANADAILALAAQLDPSATQTDQL